MPQRIHLAHFKDVNTYEVWFEGPFNAEKSWLIAPIQISTTSSWSALSDQQSMGGFPQMTAHLAGRSTLISLFTKQMWMGSEVVNVQFEVGFVALMDAFEEVVKPVREMLKFPLPETLDNPLIPPANAMLSSADRFTVHGKYFRIPDLLPVTVQPQFSKVMAEDGHPISATVSLTSSND